MKTLSILCAVVTGLMLSTAAISSAASQEVDPSFLSARELPGLRTAEEGPSLFSTSSAPGYCESDGGSHQFEYILDVVHTQLTEDTMAITVEVFIENPLGCVSGEPCPSYDLSPEFINGWIDWDGDGLFEESERVLDVALTGYLGINYYGTMTTSTIVSVPTDAVDITWMRINLGWETDPNDPCLASWTWGDIVDRVVSPRIAVPRIDRIEVTGIPDANNPMTSDSSVAGVEKVRLEAVVVDAEGFQVTNVAWFGDVPAGNGNPYEFIADPGSHGMTYVVCAITYEDTTTHETWTDTKSRNFRLFFPKTGDDDGDSEPNWFKYWQQDGAVPNMDRFLYDGTASWYGCFCSGKLYLGSIAAGQHYSSPIVLNTHFGTESFGGPTVKGIDCAAEIIGHELYHLWVGDQWKSGGLFHGQDDSDEGVPCTSCDDNLPDDYENNTSFTDADDKTDTYDLENKKHSDYKKYGDNEYMAMRAGHGSRGIVIRDWANPGKQSNPPEGCHTLGEYAPVYAQLTGFSLDRAVDLDDDGWYDLLRVEAELNVTAGGLFRISGMLMDSGSNPIARVRTDLIRFPGTHLIALDFDGQEIRQAGIDGPYQVGIVVDDDEGMPVDQTPVNLITAVYRAARFEPVDAVFSGVFRDSGVDTDGDGFFDLLRTEVTVNVTTPTSYIVEGGLYDRLGTAIDTRSVGLYLGAGSHRVNLDFDGEAIRRNRVDGPYQVRFLGVGTPSPTDFILDAHTTDPYPSTAFGNPDARFTGIFSDAGVDTDSDGFFNHLSVQVQVQVSSPGNYSLTGWLYDAGGGRIVQASTTRFLAAGIHGVPLDFSGAGIYLNGVDGPFLLRHATLFNPAGLLIDSLRSAWETAAYDAADFQRPLIGLTGHYTDYGVDDDADGKLDRLTVAVGVLVSRRGYCVAKARLTDVTEKEIAWAEKIVELEAGSARTIELDFSGGAIYANGVDGPYHLSDVYIYHVGDPYQPAYVSDAYITSSYTRCQFGDCPPVAEAGFDRWALTGPACLATVELDGSASHDPDGDPITHYTWSWSVNGNPHSAVGVAPTIELPIGVHTVSLVVSAGGMDSAPDTATITVVDNTPPEIAVSLSPNLLWPANHKLVNVTAAVTATDSCDDAPRIVLSSIVSSEPDDTIPGGDGHTTADIQQALPGTADYEFLLRAERSGSGSGRRYTVTYMAVDAAGNVATGEATVTVPVSK